MNSLLRSLLPGGIWESTKTMNKDDAVGGQSFKVQSSSGPFDLLHFRGKDRDVLRIHQRKAVGRFWLIQMTGR